MQEADQEVTHPIRELLAIETQAQSRLIVSTLST